VILPASASACGGLAVLPIRIAENAAVIERIFGD
jgi:hypothetical protein